METLKYLQVEHLMEYSERNIREKIFQFYSSILIDKFSSDLEFWMELSEQNLELST